MVRGEGSPNADVMVISFSPGKDEVEAKRPFAGSMGQIVRGLIEGIVGGDNVYYTHLVKRPLETGKKPSVAKLKGCAQHISEEIRRIKPVVVITVGAKPLDFFVTRNPGITKMHGLVLDQLSYGHHHKILPVYDIAYVMRRGGVSGAVGHEWIDDLEELRRIRGVECV